MQLHGGVTWETPVNIGFAAISMVVATPLQVVPSSYFSVSAHPCNGKDDS